MYTVMHCAAGMAILHVLSAFSSTPTWILSLTISSESQLKVRKYCQLLTHESNTILDEQYIIPPIQMNGGANAE